MTTGWQRIIAHADMDAFYASVEQLDNPDLCGQAMVIGPQSKRGVVLTASYEARQFGIKSAMPMAEALRRCPDILVVPPRFERYQEQSAAIMAAFNDFSPQVEALSLDEAFVDMSGAEGIFGAPEQMAEQIKSAVYTATGGLTASVGVSATKYVAKVASDFNKPDGICVVPPEDAVAWLDPMPVSRLWGAGPKTVPRLQRIGLYTIGDVRRADSQWLEQNMGRSGMHFQTLANARDPRPVARRRSARSIGSDRTLNENVSSKEAIELHLRRSADRIGRRLRNKGYRCRGVRVRLKTADFKLLTRQVQLPEPTDVADQLYAVATGLLSRFQPNQSIRLVGMAAFDLSRENDPQQFDLFGEKDKSQALEVTVDRVIEKYGNGMVVRAGDLQRSRTVADYTPNLDFIDDSV
ncbi:hypothetical protein AB833_18840 [Chromatiales bacterium (ex Bugula neritina AB1)]|nr:hypothetical protein AB833_18840 [Chromatiales bacterium (ex Bugula neritina AB1)]